MGTRVTFLGLEAEDLFAILARAVVSNLLEMFLHREMLGIPMNMVIQYLVPVLSIPALMLFNQVLGVRCQWTHPRLACSRLTRKT